MDKNGKEIQEGAAVVLRASVLAVNAGGSVTVETESGYRITGSASEFEVVEVASEPAEPKPLLAVVGGMEFTEAEIAKAKQLLADFAELHGPAPNVAESWVVRMVKPSPDANAAPQTPQMECPSKIHACAFVLSQQAIRDNADVTFTIASLSSEFAAKA